MRRFAPLLAPLACALAGGCSSLPTACTTDARPALLVSVFDANSRVLLSAKVVARDGAYADSALTNRQYGTGLAIERPGVYDLTVTAARHETWTRTGIRVEAGDCHVEGLHVEAALVPTP